jgi:hypothetical protein
MLLRVTAVINIVNNGVFGQGDRNRDGSGGSEPSDNRPSRLSRPTLRPVPVPQIYEPISDVDDDDTSDRATSETNTTIRDDTAIAHVLNPLSAICLLCVYR